MAIKKLLFCGTGKVAAACLKSVHENLFSKFAPVVITPHPQRIGRGKKQWSTNVVFDYCKEKSIPTINAPYERKFKLDDWEGSDLDLFSACDVGVVVDFGYFLPSDLIRAVNHGFINVHPSLLPRYRGASPIQRAIMNGDKETGVSIMQLNPESNSFDTGDIILQKRTDLSQTVTYNELTEELANLGASMLHQVLDEELYNSQNSSHQLIKQKDLNWEPAKAPMLSKKDGQLKPSEMTAKHIFNLYRSLGDTVGVQVLHNKKLVRLGGIKLVEDPDLEKSTFPGQVHFSKSALREHGCIYVRCKEGVISCQSFQPENKKVMTAQAFANGYLGVKNKTTTFF